MQAGVRVIGTKGIFGFPIPIENNSLSEHEFTFNDFSGEIVKITMVRVETPQVRGFDLSRCE